MASLVIDCQSGAIEPCDNPMLLLFTKCNTTRGFHYSEVLRHLTYVSCTVDIHLCIKNMQAHIELNLAPSYEQMVWGVVMISTN